MKIAIIGTGNIGGAIARGLAQGTIFQPSDIICTTQSDESLERVRQINSEFVLTHDNVAAVKQADLILIAVKPWRVERIIDEIKSAIDFNRQIILSVAAGVTFDLLSTFLTKNMDYNQMSTPTIFRLMPNTAIEVRSSMTFVSARNATQEQIDLVLRIFNELGNAMLIEERLMAAGTALASSGIALHPCCH